MQQCRGDKPWDVLLCYYSVMGQKHKWSWTKWLHNDNCINIVMIPGVFTTEQSLQHPAVCLWRVTGLNKILQTSLMNLQTHSMLILLSFYTYCVPFCEMEWNLYCSILVHFYWFPVIANWSHCYCKIEFYSFVKWNVTILNL